MPFRYDKLFALLKERKIKKTEMKAILGCSSNTMSAMTKGETISMKNLGKLCEALDCQPGDIIEYVKENPAGE